MTITKLGHCCLLIEYKGKRILTDPGAYSTAQNELTDLDLILITHEHADHLHVESLEMIIKNNPGVKVITNTAVGKLLSEKNIAFDILEEGSNTTFENILLEAFGSKHEEIWDEIGRVQNTGYFIDNKLFYPGDAFTNPGKAVEVLAWPVAGPWASLKRALEYVLLLKPKIAFPVHDGMIMKGRNGALGYVTPQVLDPAGIKFIPLGEGEHFEVGD